MIPEGKQLEQLEEDYQKMIDSNMLFGVPVSFSDIVSTMQSLSQRLV